MVKRTIVIADTPTILTRMRSAGFSELGLVFSTAAGWRRSYEYMVPYGVPLDARGVAATHRRGGKVWPVVARGLSLTTLLGLGSVDGVLVDRLAAALPLPAVPRLPAVPQLQEPRVG